MQILDGRLVLSATDLSNHLACRHLTSLDSAVAHGLARVPPSNDPGREALRERGFEHERRYLDSLAVQGLRVVNAGHLRAQAADDFTLRAMSEGVDIIAQGALRRDGWSGRPDVLRRIRVASGLGPWSYEVIDTKLAANTRAGTVLQLALYTDLLAAAQGYLPEYFYVVTPKGGLSVLPYRVLDHLAYYRLVRKGLERFVRHDAATANDTYPEPVPNCDVCRWWQVCNAQWHADDHLSLVAGISRVHRRTLEAEGIETLERLARLPLPLPFSPARGSSATYERVREQARVQLEGRLGKVNIHELLQPFDDEHGIARLPQPSAGDIFLDLEGDPFVESGGREFLFGFATSDGTGGFHYRGLWALTEADERNAFESLVDVFLAAWARDPALHIYHYAPYEPSALKRLMQRHATRQEEVDRMLRAELFVDLYGVVKHALRASVESYSIKALEPFYGFERNVDLRTASAALHSVERALELGEAHELEPGLCANVEGYDRDDCVSALRLREWLEGLRTEVERDGVTLPRRPPKPVEAEREPKEEELRARELAALLLAGVPTFTAERTPSQRALWLLAHLLGWHHREEQAPWWEFFRLKGLTDQKLLEEPDALAGLQLVARLSADGEAPVDRYTFPPQEVDIRDGAKLNLLEDGEFGECEDIDRDARTIDVKKRSAMADVHPTGVFAFSVVGTKPLKQALLRIAGWVAENSLEAPGPFQAARDMLLGRVPRLSEGSLVPQDGEESVAQARRLGLALDQTVLPIQGPPGSGKTYVGARMLCEMVRKGKRVGVTAVSHKAVRNLLDEVVRAASDFGLDPACIVQKVGKKSTPSAPFREVTTNGAIETALNKKGAKVVGGTPWLWAGEELAEAVDVLFIDEAGQLSLANAVAVSQAAKSVVMLGDPRQLEQPQQGSHPEGTDLSALEHLLQGHPTMPPDRGLFLAETWRLAPSICSFTSELFYESRLTPHAGLERQSLIGAGPFSGSGLWYVPVEHDGNRGSSDEEVDAVERAVEILLSPQAESVDREGEHLPLTANDILVVAPYNAHVVRLRERLEARGVRVGTVDRFQGQEAPIVIYSLASSSPEDAPRGMEFLYSPHRLNVATSRAKCACIIVGNPRLFEPECRTPDEIRLANAFCRYRELARAVDLQRMTPRS